LASFVNHSRKEINRAERADTPPPAAADDVPMISSYVVSFFSTSAMVVELVEELRVPAIVGLSKTLSQIVVAVTPRSTQYLFHVQKISFPQLETFAIGW
jgi:hypothetical protein